MYRVVLLVCILSISSCLQKEDIETYEFRTKGDSVPAKVYIEQPQMSAGSKSSFWSGDIDRLTDLNVFVYHNGRLVEESSGYFDDVTTLMLTFPFKKDVFNIYMFGNVGPCEAPMYEDNVCDLRYVLGSYEEFRVKGVPVSGTFMGFSRGDLAEFPLKRLVGQFNITMTQSAYSAYYHVKDIRVMNCALDVYPFSEGTKPNLFSRSLQYGDRCLGDMLTEEDIKRLNAGSSVSLYFVENLQGELLPGNTDRKSKVPSSLPDEVAECCTYVEITADVITPMAVYSNSRYRFYPGENETTDFSIRRNTLYEILLDFTQNMVVDQEWRIESDYPDVVDVWMDKDEAMVIKGAEDMIVLQAFDNNGLFLDFDVKLLSSSGYINVEKEIVGKGKDSQMRLRFTSNVELSGVYPIGKDPSYLSETVRVSSKETYNGHPLFVKDIPVKVYYKLFPIHVSLERRSISSPYSVTLRSRNPMGLGISVLPTYVFNGQTVTLGKCSACNCIDDGSMMPVNNAVGLSPKYFGELSDGVLCDNLTSLDLAIRGVADESVEGAGYFLSYPKLLKEVELFTGNGTKAFFGPGVGLKPEGGLTFWDDDVCNINYIFGGVVHDWWISEDRSINVTMPDFMPFCMCNNAYAYLNAGSGHCAAYVPVTGFGDVPFKIENADLHAGLPFYIVNATLGCKATRIISDGTLGNWNNKVQRGVAIEFLGPGRDLFRETRSQAIFFNRRHYVEFLIEVWKNLFGKVKTHQSSRQYAGRSFLTINGSSTWVGGDNSDYGVSPDDV